MNRHVFMIYDTVAETFIGNFIIDRHAAPVCRLFHQLLADKATQLAQHPNDFQLLHVGFVEDTGQLWPIEPTVIATGSAWLATQTPDGNG